MTQKQVRENAMSPYLNLQQGCNLIIINKEEFIVKVTYVG